MGMTKGDEIILGRLYIPDTNPDKFLFFQPTGNLNGYFLGVATADGLFVFYVDKSLSLISAAQKLKGKDAVAVSVSDDHVKKNMNLAMDCWAGIADDADTPCSGEQQKKLRETER